MPTKSHVCVPPSSISPGFNSDDRRRSPGNPGKGRRRIQPIIPRLMPARPRGWSQTERRATSSEVKINPNNKSETSDGSTNGAVFSKLGEVFEVIQNPIIVNIVPEIIIINGAIKEINAKDFRSQKVTISIRLWLVNPITPNGQIGAAGVIKKGTARGM